MRSELNQQEVESQPWSRHLGLIKQRLAERSQLSLSSELGLFEQPDQDPTLRDLLKLMDIAEVRFHAVATNQPVEVVKCIKEISTRKGIYVTALARSAGVNRSHLSGMLNDANPNPTLWTLHRLVVALSAEQGFILVSTEAAPTPEQSPDRAINATPFSPTPTLELMFVAKWLIGAPMETVEREMGVPREWIHTRLNLMASELPSGRVYRTDVEVAQAYLLLKENAAGRPGIVVPPEACDPARWRDVLAASLGDQEAVTPIRPVTPLPQNPSAANDGAPVAAGKPVEKPRKRRPEPKGMSITKNLQSDLERMQAEQQPALVLQVLRRQRDALTFEDVRTLLASPLGRGLACVEISELFKGDASDSPAIQSPTRPAKPKRSRSSRAKNTRRRRRGSGGATGQVSALTVAGRKAYDNAIVDVLRKSGGWQSPRHIRETAGGTESQFQRAIHRLIEAGRVKQTGTLASSKYSAN